MTDPQDHRPTERFSSRASSYARARPGYPREAFESICDDLLAGGTAVDVGAGTGLSTRVLRDLLGEGWDVIAIEPNAPMREASAGDEGIRWLDGTAEATGLEDSSCDLIVCAQAFHWFDADRAVAEFRRVLRRSGGRVALIWNTHDTEAPGMSGYRETMMRHATEPPTSPSCSGWNAADVSALERSGSFGEVSVRSFANHQDLDLQGLIDRATSSSYIPSDGPACAALVDDLRAHFEAHSRDGIIRLAYHCTVHMADAIVQTCDALLPSPEFENLWIGLVEVSGDPSHPQMQGATGGAVVIVIVMCRSAKEYTDYVRQAVSEYGLSFMDIEWCSSLNKHLEREAVADAYVLDMIDAVQTAGQSGGIGFCTFHTWDREENPS